MGFHQTPLPLFNLIATGWCATLQDGVPLSNVWMCHYHFNLLKCTGHVKSLSYPVILFLGIICGGLWSSHFFSAHFGIRDFSTGMTFYKTNITPSESPPMVYFYMIYVWYIYLHVVQFYGCIMLHIRRLYRWIPWLILMVEILCLPTWIVDIYA